MQDGRIFTYYIDASRRFRQVRMNQMMSSPLLIALFLLTFLAAALLWVAAVAVAGDNFLLPGAALILSGLSGGLLLLFTYASTTLPFAAPPQTTTGLLRADTSSRNIADAFDYRLVAFIGRHLVDQSQKELQHIFRALLKDSRVSELLRRLEVSEADIYQTVIGAVVPRLTMPQLAYTVLSQAAIRGEEYIDIVDMAGVFLLHPGLHNFWRQYNLREDDVSFGLWWQHTWQQTQSQARRWWAAENMLRFTGIGLSWASGFTPFVDQFSHVPSGDLWDVPYGHLEQVEELITALARARQSNVLVVGHPGVGRLGVVKELARRVNAATAHPALNGQRIIYMHISQLLALGASGAGQLSMISRALDEMERAGNVVAVLDGVSSILGAAGEQQINLTDLLVPFFSSGKVRVVVIMSSDEYHVRIKNNAELLHFFEIVQVPPLDERQTLQLMALTAPTWETAADMFVPYRTLREIVAKTASILPFIPFPEKAFDLLEEAVVRAQGSGANTITVADVHHLISLKVGVNVGVISGQEQQHLLQLEDIIHRRIVNQETAVAAVARAMIRSRAGVRSLKRPIGTFLFLGPTGVGKTETAKALAEAYFGSQDYMQRLDMTDFQGEQSVERLTGGGSHETGALTALIADHPFSVLLLDEFEKADSAVKQMFLPVFDEGYITDHRGHKYSFHHTIIIATSNAGAEFIRTGVSATGSVPADFNDQLREHILRQGIFQPEVLNRFDGVITFAPLTQEHIKQIATLMLRNLNKRLDAERGVTVAITEELVDYLARIGYDPEFGARPMARAIQDTVEYVVAERIVRAVVQPGQQITIDTRSLPAAA